MGTKKWNREADGIYRHVRTNKLYWRPWINGKRTWECLGTENLKLAKETYHKRAAGLPAGVTGNASSTAQVQAGPWKQSILCNGETKSWDYCSQIAFEIGHTSAGMTLAAVYGGVPPHWLNGEGPKLGWLPSEKPDGSPHRRCLGKQVRG